MSIDNDTADCPKENDNIYLLFVKTNDSENIIINSANRITMLIFL